MSVRGLSNIEGLWILKSRVACHWFMSLCICCLFKGHLARLLCSAFICFCPCCASAVLLSFSLFNLLTESTLVSPNYNWYKEKTEIFFCCSFILSRWKLPGDYTSQLRRTRKKKKNLTCWTFVRLTVKIVNQAKGKAYQGFQNTTREEQKWECRQLLVCMGCKYVAQLP